MLLSSLTELLPLLLKGLGVTLQITAAGLVVATCAAFTAGLGISSNHRAVRALARAYIDLFRGTSALVQLFWVYYALPIFGLHIEAMPAAIVVLGLNIGAYGAEVVRGALAAVPQEQAEAAAALNLTERQTLWHIRLPQALPAMMPPFGNLAIELLKSTALVSLITLADLTFQAQVLRASTLQTAEVFGLVLVLYFTVAWMLGQSVRWLERCLARSQGRA
ncbi:MAG: ectoine/hydroxyectoine ABC transporter permease subunit EhuC [Pseudomonadota bacterium]|jgi:polar amino acid transport system permease protein|nr:ectoine/hydroxyectoine ABC transporter permease subunit EhuC [Pseudomonadota bacterium]